jgi:hypothetical protein
MHFFSQLVVEKMLASEGIKRTDLSRDEFTKRVWEWKEKYISQTYSCFYSLCDLCFLIEHGITFFCVGHLFFFFPAFNFWLCVSDSKNIYRPCVIKRIKGNF